VASRDGAAEESRTIAGARWRLKMIRKRVAPPGEGLGEH
jgi:hypothetical protein